MANIDRIVNVQIALRTRAVAQMNFSGMMLVGVTTATPRVSIITKADDLLTGFGLTTTSPLYLAAQVAFAQTPSPAQIYIGRRDSAEAAGTAIAAIAAENSDWYGFTDVANSSADTESYSAWAESNQKLFGTALATASLGTGGLAETLKTNQRYRTMWWYAASATLASQWPQVAAMVKAFSKLPGADDWANMTLASVAYTNINETTYNQIKTLNGNTFEPFREVAITQNGKTVAGEWIDIIRGRDWLQEEIRTNVFNTMVDRKIPYEDSGIAIIHAALRQSLDLGVTRGFIAGPAVDGSTVIPSYTTSVPAAAGVSVANKAARVLNDVTFTARIAGAIHAVNINGTLVYDGL